MTVKLSWYPNTTTPKAISIYILSRLCGEQCSSAEQLCRQYHGAVIDHDTSLQQIYTLYAGYKLIERYAALERLDSSLYLRKEHLLPAATIQHTTKTLNASLSASMQGLSHILDSTDRRLGVKDIARMSGILTREESTAITKHWTRLSRLSVSPTTTPCNLVVNLRQLQHLERAISSLTKEPLFHRLPSFKLSSTCKYAYKISFPGSLEYIFCSHAKCIELMSVYERGSNISRYVNKEIGLCTPYVEIDFFGLLIKGHTTEELSFETGLSCSVVNTIIKKVYHRFPELLSFRDSLLSFAKEQSYVQNTFGRVRYLLNMENPIKRGQYSLEWLTLSTLRDFLLSVLIVVDDACDVALSELEEDYIVVSSNLNIRASVYSSLQTIDLGHFHLPLKGKVEINKKYWLFEL